MLVLIAARVGLPGNVTLGAVLSILMIPLWWRSLERYRGARTLMAVGGVALLSGVWLTELTRSTNPVSVSLMISVSVLVGGALCGVGVVLWSRQFLTDGQVALAFGAGILLGVSPNSALFAENPWKFGFAVPIAIILLALAQLTGRRVVEAVVVLALTVASALADARSSFAILMATALLVFWQMRPGRASRRASALRVVAGLAALGVIIYTFVQALILDGVLGEETRLRSLEQIDSSGSLLLGGRPELAATIALLQGRPWGYGAGTIPSFADVTTAKTGMAAIGYQPDNGYVENYMFGGRFELHSLFGDFWASFGIPGIVLIAVLVGPPRARTERSRRAQRGECRAHLRRGANALERAVRAGLQLDPVADPRVDRPGVASLPTGRRLRARLTAVPSLRRDPGRSAQERVRDGGRRRADPVERTAMLARRPPVAVGDVQLDRPRRARAPRADVRRTPRPTRPSESMRHAGGTRRRAPRLRAA